MDKHLILLVVITLLSSCNGGRLGGLLLGAHQQIHNTVHEVADVFLGGFNHAHQHPQPVQQPAKSGGETIVVIVEETNQGGQTNQRPYGTPQHGHYPPPRGYNPNNVYNQGNPNYGHNHPNHGHHHHAHRPNQGSNYGHGQGPHQNGDNVNKYGNENFGQRPNAPIYPNQQGQHNNDQDHNQNGQNNNAQNGNMNPYPTGYPPSVITNPNPTGNEVISSEQQKPNTNDNYKPTEANHHKNNDKTSKKPEDDGPLLVPLNDYTYGGDKIVINAPKRDTDNTNKKNEESEDDFPIDIRFKDE